MVLPLWTALGVAALCLLIGGLIGYAVGYRLGVGHTIFTVLAILPKDQAKDVARVFKYHMDKHKKTGVGKGS